MDLDKFRAQWEDPEFEQSYARLDPEPTSSVIERMKSMDRRDKRWRITRKIIVWAALLVFLALAVAGPFVLDIREEPIRALAFVLEMVVILVLLLVDRAREKYAQPKLWLSPDEFQLDEHRRMSQNIRLDQWVSGLLCLAIICLAVYAAPFLSAGLQGACLDATVAAVLALVLYDRHKISQLKRSRDALAAQLSDPPRD